MLFPELQTRFFSNDLLQNDGLKEMQYLSNRLNRLVNSEYSNYSFEHPTFNVYSNQDSAIITSELPGIELDDIDIQIVHNTITIKTNKMEEKLDAETSHWLKRERTYGQMVRSVELPFEVDANKTKAKFNRGILTIELPRKEEDKPKKISIKAN